MKIMNVYMSTNDLINITFSNASVQSKTYEQLHAMHSLRYTNYEYDDNLLQYVIINSVMTLYKLTPEIRDLVNNKIHDGSMWNRFPEAFRYKHFKRTDA